MSEVWVLGAGFSRAISPRMPVLTELTGELLRSDPASLEGIDTALFKEDIESVLTFLGTAQPWLDRTDQLHNEARFLRVARAIGKLIADRQNEALANPIPDWLRGLLDYWATSKVTVVTLNYDTLVEKGVCEMQPTASQSAGYTSLYPLAAMPSHRRGPTLFPAGELVDLFELLRPHGSMHWIYSGRSGYGEQIYQTTVEPRWAPDASTTLRDFGLDKVPLIVPPALAKTEFIRNEFLELQWRQAAAALAAAERIGFLGYSLPATDATFRQLLAVCVRQSPSIIVANPDPRAMDRYQGLFGGVDTAFTDAVSSIPDVSAWLIAEK